MLAPGSRVGPYEVVSPLSAGGMGEVFRARDTTLGRDVALKTLPSTVTGQPDRLARLRREARILASLNHPGIATLHGVEESGGVPVLVMELVEGETLSDRLHRARLPLKDVLRVGHEIAAAVATAHQKGVLHRDLKPSNIRLGLDGRVKLLDFGLARALAQDDADLHSQVSTATSSTSRPGAVVGTAPYMSPEQARGLELDERSDVWAFGCVLYEMLARRRAFPGATFSEVSAAILEREPDWQALPEGTPLLLGRLVHRCLRKDKDSRPRYIADVGLELKELMAEIQSGGSHRPGSALAAAPGAMAWPPRARTVAAVLGVMALAGVAALELRRREPTVTPADTRQPRFQLTLPRGVVLPRLGTPPSALAISPDGQRVVFVGCGPGPGCRLYTRHVRELDPRLLAGTEGGSCPFFSPDGRSIGFHAEGRLKKVATDGGAVVALADAPQMRGGSWGEDGSILFATGGSGLLHVSAEGGRVTEVTQPDHARHERDHRWPQFLPGHAAALLDVMYDNEEHAAAVADLLTGKTTVLVERAGSPRYSSTGHLLFGRYGIVYAAAFDVAKRELTAEPVAVLDGVAMWNSPGIAVSSNGLAQLDVAQDGTLLFSPREARLPRRTLVWLERRGRMTPLPAVEEAYSEPALSPDGRRLAVQREGAEDTTTVFIIDLAKDAWTRVSFDRRTAAACWMPDGKRLVAISQFGEGWRLVLLSAAGVAEPETIYEGGAGSRPTPDRPAVAPDGRAVLFWAQTGAQWDIWRVGLTPAHRAEPWLATPANEMHPKYSPDGRWVAYVSNESGRGEIYARPYPAANPRYLVSTQGGDFPRWSRDGREIFFVNRGSLWAVSVRTSPGFACRAPRELFAIPEDILSNWPFYDVTPDGQRFVMVRNDPLELRPLDLVLVPKWTEELAARLAATKRTSSR